MVNRAKRSTLLPVPVVGLPPLGQWKRDKVGQWDGQGSPDDGFRNHVLRDSERRVDKWEMADPLAAMLDAGGAVGGVMRSLTKLTNSAGKKDTPGRATAPSPSDIWPEDNGYYIASAGGDGGGSGWK